MSGEEVYSDLCVCRNRPQCCSQLSFPFWTQGLDQKTDRPSLSNCLCLSFISGEKKLSLMKSGKENDRTKILQTKQHDYDQDRDFALGVRRLKAVMPLNVQIAAWHRVDITEKHKETEEGVGSGGEGTSPPREEEGVGSIQEEQGDTMQQGQCWVSKVHELQGTSGGRQQ